MGYDDPPSPYSSSWTVVGQRGANPSSPAVVINLYRHAALSPTLLAAGVAHTPLPRGWGQPLILRRNKGVVAVTGGPPWPRTDRRTNGLARKVDLRIMCVRACVRVCRVFFFCECSRQHHPFFFFFFSSSFDMVWDVCVVCVHVCRALYLVHVWENEWAANKCTGENSLFPLEENWSLGVHGTCSGEREEKKIMAVLCLFFFKAIFFHCLGWCLAFEQSVLFYFILGNSVTR